MTTDAQGVTQPAPPAWTPLPHPADSGTRLPGATEVQPEALVELGRRLRGIGYRFVTITPETHRRVNARPASAQARDVADVFGWSRPFAQDVLPPGIWEAAVAAGVLASQDDGLFRSTVRWSSLGADLYVHSAYPTWQNDAVFFGPDTYRFVSAVRDLAPRARRAVDVGCGSGAGALSLRDRVEQIVLADVNQQALRLARINAIVNDVPSARVQLVCSDVLQSVPGEVDLVIANPPYLVDAQARAYRDGGGSLGLDLAVRIVRESLPRLTGGGSLVLYTGCPVVDGTLMLVPQVKADLDRWAAGHWSVDEMDPDVFGEELDAPAYEHVDRIAAVTLVARVR